MNIKLTSSYGIIAIPRVHNGVIIDFGMNTYSENVKSFDTLNDVRSKFEDTYGEKIKGFYLSIDESIVNWGSRRKLLPLCVRCADFIMSETNTEGKVVHLNYDEFTILTQTYDNQFTIWECLIRERLGEGSIEIDENQLHRLINPVLSDNNENLIHKLSRHNLPKLRKIFDGTSLG